MTAAPTRRMRPTVRARHRAVRARGAMLLFILLTGLPMLWLSGAIAVDYSRVLVAHRQAGHLADAASLAGAQQLVPNDPDDPFASSMTLCTAPTATRCAGKRTAEQAARALVTEAETSGGANRLRVDRVAVQIQQRSTSSPATVTVTIDYTIDDLLFLGLATGVTGDSVQHGSITRSAIVCEPGQAPTFQGRCTRPRF